MKNSHSSRLLKWIIISSMPLFCASLTAQNNGYSNNQNNNYNPNYYNDQQNNNYQPNRGYDNRSNPNNRNLDRWENRPGDVPPEGYRPRDLPAGDYSNRHTGYSPMGDWDYRQQWQYYAKDYLNGLTQSEVYDKYHPYGPGGIGYDPDEGYLRLQERERQLDMYAREQNQLNQRYSKEIGYLEHNSQNQRDNSKRRTPSAASRNSQNEGYSRYDSSRDRYNDTQRSTGYDRSGYRADRGG